MEQIGWVLMGLLLATALIGLFGAGPLSRATAGKRGSLLWIEYNRFDRYEAPTKFKVHVGSELTSTNVLELWLNQDFLDKAEIEHASPEPDSFEATPNGAVYHFKLARTNEPVTLLLQFRATGYGSVPVQLGIRDGPQVRFKQFFYP